MSKFSQQLPNKEGYYWFYDRSDDTPCVLDVSWDGDNFYASDEVFGFTITEAENEFWCYIKRPELPLKKEREKGNHL